MAVVSLPPWHHVLRFWMWVLGTSESESRLVVADSLHPHDYTIHGILQARILEWVAFPSTRGSSQPRDWTQVSHIAGGFFSSWAAGEAHEYRRKAACWNNSFPVWSPVSSNSVIWGLLKCKLLGLTPDLLNRGRGRGHQLLRMSLPGDSDACTSVRFWVCLRGWGGQQP